MNREILQKLSEMRLKEGKHLLDAKAYEGAYYLTGYAVECGLKACIAKLTKRFDFPDKNQTIQVYTHDLTVLLKAAGLSNNYDVEIKKSTAFRINWVTTKDWSEQKRYSLAITEQDAKGLYSAVSSRRYGILAWIKRHW